MDHTFLFPFKVQDWLEYKEKYRQKESREFKSKLDEALSKNEWIHAEVKIVNMLYSVWNDEVVVQSGVHVIKHLTRMDDIQFTDSSSYTSVCSLINSDYFVY
jgi:hypothetical protein